MNIFPNSSRIACFLALSLLFCACSTVYHIPVDLLQSQLNNSKAVVKNVEPSGKKIHIGITHYTTNGLEYIECLDKDDNKMQIEVTPNIMVTLKDSLNNVSKVYFDTLVQTDSTFVGSTSHIVNSTIIVPIKSVSNITIIPNRKNSLSYKQKSE